MRLPLPQRFKPSQVTLFVLLIFLGQVIEGTDIVFAVLTSVFIVLWATAFNVAGGIEYTSGAFIFFNGLFTVVLGMMVKVLLLQAGDKNLRSPRTTILAYCVGMACMAAAVVFSSGLRRSRPLLKDFASLSGMKDAAIASFAIALLFTAFLSGSAAAAAGSAGGNLTSALNQLNRFPLLTIILATVYELRRSEGRRSINWINGLGLIYASGIGVIYFSKEGMLIGPTTWFITCWLNRYSFSKVQLFGSVLGIAFTVYYLVPYSQYVRLMETSSKTQNFAVAVKYLSNLNETRQLYLDQLDNYDIDEEAHLFDQRIGFLDRLIMFAPDDLLIAFTEKGNVFGYTPSLITYANVVPHVIWRNKPSQGGGNIYAHELGIVAEEDTTTGISFSPVGDAFHQGRWLALVLLLPTQMFIGLLVADSVAGSSRQTTWAILWIIEVSHLASEGGASAPVYFYAYGLLAMLFCYWTLTRIVPFVLMQIRRNNQGTPLRMPVAETP